MKIKLIPDARNEELIADIKHALEALEDDALEEYLSERVCQGEEWYDAMYYAAEERGDGILSQWEEYFYMSSFLWRSRSSSSFCCNSFSICSFRSIAPFTDSISSIV